MIVKGKSFPNPFQGIEIHSNRHQYRTDGSNYQKVFQTPCPNQEPVIAPIPNSCSNQRTQKKTQNEMNPNGFQQPIMRCIKFKQFADNPNRFQWIGICSRQPNDGKHDNRGWPELQKTAVLQAA
eukprot:c1502_g1_i1 orf=3-371(-)